VSRGGPPITYFLAVTGQQNALGIFKLDLAFQLSEDPRAIGSDGPKLLALMTPGCRRVAPQAPEVALARCFQALRESKTGAPTEWRPYDVADADGLLDGRVLIR